MTARSRRPLVVRAPAGAAALAVLVALASGCASTPPEPAPRAGLTVVVPAPPEAVLSTLRDAAMRLGGRITDEKADSFRADYGVESRSVAMPTEGGALRAAPPRETEIHSSATYTARRDGPGTLVTISEEVAYWHPDRRLWLRLPQEAAAASPASPPAPR